MRRFAVHIAALTAVWVLLWGRLSVANVVSGTLVSAALLAVFPLERRRRDTPFVVRPVAALTLMAHFLVQLVVSNSYMAWQIVRPHPALRTGIVACPLHTRSPGLITLITDILALSPGTITVDVTMPDPAKRPAATEVATIYVHVLRLDDPADTRRQVAEIERLVVEAFGVRAEVDACRLVKT